MPVYKLTAYPKQVTLRDGSVVTLRPMEKEDAEGLLALFQDVPPEDRWFLKEDVTSEKVIREWVEHLDYNRALPLLAIANGRIVADGVLVRHRGVARQHLAEVRIVVHPAWRNRGLGSTILKELCDIAAEAEVEKVMSELVEDVEKDAIDAMERLGFIRSAVIPDLLRDMHGRPHNVVVLTLPLGKYWQWAQW